MNLVFAATDWPDAAIGIAGIALVGVIVAVVVWQLMATWRARMSGTRELAYRRLAEEATGAQSRTALALEQTLAELRTISSRTGELERVLKEVG